MPKHSSKEKLLSRIEMEPSHTTEIPGAVVNLTQKIVDTVSDTLASRPYSTDTFFRNDFDFKRDHSFAARKEEATRVRNKYPDRIPVICQKAKQCDMPDIDKHKFLVPEDLTVGQFMYVVRRRMEVSEEKAIYLFVNNTIPPTSVLMQGIYQENKDEDGFLYVVFSSENTFG